jgi:hypothetical protein
LPSSEFDFSYMDTLRLESVGRGRIFFGQVTKSDPDRPILLLIHGGHHGAWCYAHYLQYFDNVGIPAAAMDMRGHGGLPQDADLAEQGARELAEDVIAFCQMLARPVIPVCHSAGALVGAVAGEQMRFYGFGLLAPSPPGQLECLHSLPLVPAGGLIPPPDQEICRHKFLAGEAVIDIRPFIHKLCPESPRLLNDRRSLAIHIDQTRFDMPALCISAGRDRGDLHPEGQDLETAHFFGAEYHCLEAAPHCMMVSAEWRKGADLIADWYRRITKP